MKNFDPGKHPRNTRGEFAHHLGELAKGESLHLPGGVHVTNHGDNSANPFSVQIKGESLSTGHGLKAHVPAKNAQEAADKALTASAKSNHPDSLGGPKSHSSLPAALKANRARARREGTANQAPRDHMPSRLPTSKQTPDYEEHAVARSEQASHEKPAFTPAQRKSARAAARRAKRMGQSDQSITDNEREVLSSGGIKRVKMSNGPDGFESNGNLLHESTVKKLEDKGLIKRNGDAYDLTPAGKKAAQGGSGSQALKSMKDRDKAKGGDSASVNRTARRLGGVTGKDLADFTPAEKRTALVQVARELKAARTKGEYDKIADLEDMVPRLGGVLRGDRLLTSKPVVPEAESARSKALKATGRRDVPQAQLNHESNHLVEQAGHYRETLKNLGDGDTAHFNHDISVQKKSGTFHVTGAGRTSTTKDLSEAIDRIQRKEGSAMEGKGLRPPGHGNPMKDWKEPDQGDHPGLLRVDKALLQAHADVKKGEPEGEYLKRVGDTPAARKAYSDSAFRDVNGGEDLLSTAGKSHTLIKGEPNLKPKITAHDAGGGKTSYHIDGKPDIEGSKVNYTHASVYHIPAGGGEKAKRVIKFHKSEAAANKATYKYGNRVGTVPIERTGGGNLAGDAERRATDNAAMDRGDYNSPEDRARGERNIAAMAKDKHGSQPTAKAADSTTRSSKGEIKLKKATATGNKVALWEGTAPDGKKIQVYQYTTQARRADGSVGPVRAWAASHGSWSDSMHANKGAAQRALAKHLGGQSARG